MKISIYTLSSALHDKASTERIAFEFLSQIEEKSGIRFKHCGSDFSTYGSSDLDLIYVVTGGTEALFQEVFPSLKGNIRILTSGKSNSLAASMEILSYMNENGGRGEIIHGDIEYIVRRINLLAKVEKGLKALNGAKLGVIGEPSDWLISSMPDEEALKSKLGIELVHIPVSELVGKLQGISSEPMEGAQEIYLALKELVIKHSLYGLTIRCFDLLDKIDNTACLALAKLNGEGIPAGCEGDVPTLVTMAVGNALTGKSGFQANPSRINPATSEFLFAHCTVPLNMLESYTYDTHFESGIGVAIRGVLPLGNATIFKMSRDLSRSFVGRAQLVQNLSEPNLCRTQILLKGDGYAEYFLTEPIGNHHVVFVGDHQELFKAFVKAI